MALLKSVSKFQVSRSLLSGLLVLIAAFTAGCAAPQVTQGLISVRIITDGLENQVEIEAGSTVQEAIDAVGLQVGNLDRAQPPVFTVLTDGETIQIVRVEEEFLVEQVVIPYEQQVLRNESLPEGEQRLVQPGINGLQEITTRKVFEDGVEVSASLVKSVIVEEPIPEIVMVGSQTPFASIPIPGRLVYLSGGNAWLMETTTGIRRPVVTSGDLDGRVFRLSPDGSWLLFTRHEEADDVINSLWAAEVGGESPLEIDLEVTNVVHFADWSPQSKQTLAYSTVEPREAPPGWQANNDLSIVTFSSSGWISRRNQLLEANSGGIYGWWGSTFAWAPDGRRLAYARPDGVGLVDLSEDLAISLLDITPLQTNSDWAWVPGLAWGPDGNVIYTVDHAPPQGVETPEESPWFDLQAVPLLGGPNLSLVSDVGMFAYPVPSPPLSAIGTELSYQVAYLKSIFPSQSKSSRYHLLVMDRDGSNHRVLFPPDGAQGLDPQQVIWSPAPLETDPGNASASHVLAVIYQGNLWLVDALTGEGWQLTGDGLISRIDWK